MQVGSRQSCFLRSRSPGIRGYRMLDFGSVLCGWEGREDICTGVVHWIGDLVHHGA
jgi:hypothetical protein